MIPLTLIVCYFLYTQILAYSYVKLFPNRKLNYLHYLHHHLLAIVFVPAYCDFIQCRLDMRGSELRSLIWLGYWLSQILVFFWLKAIMTSNTMMWVVFLVQFVAGWVGWLPLSMRFCDCCEQSLRPHRT